MSERLNLEALITEAPPFDGTQILLCIGRWYEDGVEFGASANTLLMSGMTDMDMVRAATTGYQMVVDEYLKHGDQQS